MLELVRVCHQRLRDLGLICRRPWQCLGGGASNTLPPKPCVWFFHCLRRGIRAAAGPEGAGAAFLGGHLGPDFWGDSWKAGRGEARKFRGRDVVMSPERG